VDKCKAGQATDGTKIRYMRIACWVTWTTYEGWNFNSGNYLFTTDTK